MYKIKYMPTTPPVIISYEVDKSIDEMSQQITNIAKDLYSKHMTKNNKKIITYKCINKINGLECKGCQVDRKGTGLVLNKGEKCFDCQFYGMPWLQTTQTSSSANSSQQLLSPVRSPSSPRHHQRCNSYSASPTSPTFTEESEVDPYMFSRPVRRNGAILRATRNKGDLLISEESNNRLTIRITRPDSEISFSDEEKENEILDNDIDFSIFEETEIASSSSKDLISSPRTPRTPIMEVFSDKFKIGLKEIVTEICQQVLDLKEENELEKIKSENQKLREENKLLKQEVRELKENKLDSEESSSYEDAQDIFEMYIEIPTIRKSK